jgi:hypothetical protein
MRLGLLMNFGIATMERWHPSHCQLSGSLPVAPCSPCPRVRTMPIPLHRLSHNCHRICESDYFSVRER